MSRKIFVNLPVRDLPRSKTFFEALGFGAGYFAVFEQDREVVHGWLRVVDVLLP